MLTLVRTRRFAAAAGTAALLTAAVTGGLAAKASADDLAAHNAAAAAFEQVDTTFTVDRMELVGFIAELRSQVKASRAVLTDSEGRTLDETTRTALRTAADTAEKAAREQAAVLSDARTADVRAARAGVTGTQTLLAATEDLDIHLGFDTALLDALTTATTAVTEAVTAWETEQARLQAEAEAVAAAAASAEEAARAAEQPAHPSTSTSTSTTDDAGWIYDKWIRTSGWQAELDECSGAIDLTPTYGFAVIGEHWSCGGGSMPWSGQLTLSGVYSGVWEAHGVIATLNQATDSSGAIPRGYELLFQTCLNGDSGQTIFIALSRVG